MYTSKELAHVALLAHIRQIFTALQQLSNSRMMILSKEKNDDPLEKEMW